MDLGDEDPCIEMMTFGNDVDAQARSEQQRADFLAALEPMGVAQPLPAKGWMLLPNSVEQVSKVLALAQTYEQVLALREADARTLPMPLWLNMTLMSQVRRYREADLTLTVETGMTFAALTKLLHSHGHDWPLHYPDDMPLIDILAEDRPALETGFFGYPRDYVLGLEFITPEGHITRCGGEVVKNVSGYDLAKLYVGSFHALGVLSAATLKLCALPQGYRSWLFEFEDLHQGFQTLTRLMQQPFPFSRCELYHRDRLGPTQHAKTVAPWQLLLEIREDNALLKQVTPLIRDLVVQPESESSLHPAREKALVQRLSTWPEGDLVVEIAMPVHAAAASLEDLCFRLNTLFRIPEHTPILQLRPASGLVYLLWPPERQPAPDVLMSLLQEIQNILTQRNRWQGSFVRLAQCPTGYEAVVAQVNLPDSPLLRELMVRCKGGFDPNGILYSSRLPLAVQALGSPQEVTP